MYVNQAAKIFIYFFFNQQITNDCWMLCVVIGVSLRNCDFIFVIFVDIFCAPSSQTASLHAIFAGSCSRLWCNVALCCWQTHQRMANSNSNNEIVSQFSFLIMALKIFAHFPALMFVRLGFSLAVVHEGEVLNVSNNLFLIQI